MKLEAVPMRRCASCDVVLLSEADGVVYGDNDGRETWFCKPCGDELFPDVMAMLRAASRRNGGSWGV